MEVCGLSIVVAKDGKEYILSATDSTISLMGDTQEDDRRYIADLVVTRMQVNWSCFFGQIKIIENSSHAQMTTTECRLFQNVCRPPMTKGQPIPSRSSVSSNRASPSDENGPSVPPTGSYSRGSSISGPPPPIPERTTPGPGTFHTHPHNIHEAN